MLQLNRGGWVDSIGSFPIPSATTSTDKQSGGGGGGEEPSPYRRHRYRTISELYQIPRLQ